MAAVDVHNVQENFKNSVPILKEHNGKAYKESSFSSLLSHQANGSIKSENDVRAKKKVNICTENSVDTDHCCSETSESCDHSSSISHDKCLTMVGTIKRGKKAGQNLDVRLNISREELEMMEASLAATKSLKASRCSISSGPHILFLSLISFPFALIISSCNSFYLGTLTWYNIFTYVTEDTNICYKILFPPILILTYPFVILTFTMGLGIYAAFIQLSWFFNSWYKEICDLEKGFYGWICAIINLEECSPYEVVILTDIKVTGDSEKNSQDTVLS